jgi:outer membrane protein OmpU
MLEFIPGKEPFITHSCRGMSVGIKIESYNPRERIMKKVLLTTTALVMTAGVAAADVSFSGEAGIAFVDDNGASDATRTGMFVASHYDLNVAVSASADNGLTMSAGFDMGSGEKIDYDDDDALEVQGAAVGDADVAVSYNGWTLTVDQNGIDNLFDDDQAEDMSIAGSIGGLSVAVATDLENSTNSYKLGYSVGDIALTLTGTNNDDAGGDASGISVSYPMGALTLSASVSDESNDAEDDTSIGLTYAMDAITVSYTSITPGSNGSMGDEWDAKISYATGAMTASIALDEADATTMIANYDLGGATAFAAMHDKPGTASDLTTFGINFAF